MDTWPRTFTAWVVLVFAVISIIYSIHVLLLAVTAGKELPQRKCMHWNLITIKLRRGRSTRCRDCGETIATYHVV